MKPVGIYTNGILTLPYVKGDSMTEYCLFTIEHLDHKRIYVRGVADITEPIDDYDKIIKFYHGAELKSQLPVNPYRKGDKDYKLFEELLELIKSDFEEIGDELVFAEEFQTHKYLDKPYNLDTEKVII